MRRNIKTLANFEPPATDAEIRASALQFVRKLSGTARPSRVNDAVFQDHGRRGHRGRPSADSLAENQRAAAEP